MNKQKEIPATSDCEREGLQKTECAPWREQKKAVESRKRVEKGGEVVRGGALAAEREIGRNGVAALAVAVFVFVGYGRGSREEEKRKR